MIAGVELEAGIWGVRAVLTAPWRPDLGEALVSSNVSELELNDAKGWRGQNVDFLQGLPHLRALTIIDHSIPSVAAIHAQSELEYLDVNTYCKTAIDFDQFPALVECALEWRRGAESLFGHPGIRKLWINKLPLLDFEPMARMVGLESLSLASPRLKSFRGIEAHRRLTFLGIYLARGLKSLEGIESLEELVSLEINNSRHFTDIGPLGRLTKLERLHLCNDGKIDSLRPLSGLSRLERFLFTESTNIEDGDLSPLQMLPRLKHVAFQNRKHYSLSRADFPSGR